MRSECPIAAALDLVGDRWALVVLRDILLYHRYGFSQIAAEEGIATNILMDRLERLVAAGILERHVDSADRRRRTYLPTERAIELIPVLLDLVVWGNANTAATGVAEVAEAVRIDRDAVIRDLESTVREKRHGAKQQMRPASQVRGASRSSPVCDAAVHHRQVHRGRGDAMGRHLEQVVAQDNQVGALARFQRTDEVVEAQLTSRAEGRGVQRLSKFEPLAVGFAHRSVRFANTLTGYRNLDGIERPIGRGMPGRRPVGSEGDDSAAVEYGTGSIHLAFSLSATPLDQDAGGRIDRHPVCGELGDHAQLPESGGVGVVDELQVGDGVTTIPRRVDPDRGFDRVERTAHRAVADRVDVTVDAGGVGLGD